MTIAKIRILPLNLYFSLLLSAEYTNIRSVKAAEIISVSPLDDDYDID